MSSNSTKLLVTRALAAIALAALAGCSGSTDAEPTPGPVATFASTRHHRHHHRSGAYAAPASSASAESGPDACDDAKFVAIQRQFASGALEGDQEVDVCGPVTRVLAARTTRSGLHGYFDVLVAPNDTIEIVSDLDRMNAPAWPWVNVGDRSTVRGRYYYDSASSQGIDWTHHGTSRSWPAAGYVVVNGTLYQ